MLDKNDIHKMAVEAGLYTAPISLGPWNDKIQAFAQKLLAAQLADLAPEHAVTVTLDPAAGKP